MMILKAWLTMAFVALAVQGERSLATEVPADWKSDCVGRMQIALPGVAEVTAHTAESWVGQARERDKTSARFADGTLAGWQHTIPFKISHKLSASELIALIKHSELTAKQFATKAKTYRWDKNSFRSVRTAPANGVTWSYENVPGPDAKFEKKFLVELDQHLIQWSGFVPSGAASDLEQRVANLLGGLSSRPTHTLPLQPGLCYPYLFVKDDGQAKREVAISYRLKDHPDITVVLEDKTAPVRLRNERSQQHSAKVASISFWGRYIQSDEGAESVWRDYYQSTKLAGYRGVHSYVEIKRADGTIDYGYYVAVRGDSEAKEDEPDLTFWVIRNASVAKAKGVQPYGDEKKFLELAQSIAASVKRRPVQ
jgi:hypothetical protein